MKGHKDKASFIRKYVKKKKNIYIYKAKNFVYYVVWVLLYWVA